MHHIAVRGHNVIASLDVAFHRRHGRRQRRHSAHLNRPGHRSNAHNITLTSRNVGPHPWHCCIPNAIVVVRVTVTVAAHIALTVAVKKMRITHDSANATTMSASGISLYVSRRPIPRTAKSPAEAAFLVSDPSAQMGHDVLLCAVNG